MPNLGRPDPAMPKHGALWTIWRWDETRVAQRGELCLIAPCVGCVGGYRDLFGSGATVRSPREFLRSYTRPRGWPATFCVYHSCIILLLYVRIRWQIFRKKKKIDKAMKLFMHAAALSSRRGRIGTIHHGRNHQLTSTITVLVRKQYFVVIVAWNEVVFGHMCLKLNLELRSVFHFLARDAYRLWYQWTQITVLRFGMQKV